MIKQFVIVMCSFLVFSCGGSENSGGGSTGDPDGNSRPDIALTSGSMCSISSTNSAGTTAAAEADCLDPDVDLVDAPAVSSTGIGSGSFSGRNFNLTGAILDPDELELVFHDGQLRFNGDEQTYVWGVYSGSVVIFMEFNSTEMAAGVYSYIGDDGAQVGDGIIDAFIGVDTNGDGRATNANEFGFIDSGVVTITGAAPDWSITIDVSVQGGGQLSAQYDGDFFNLPGTGI